MGEKHIYIHFESKPSLEQLGRYFSKYPAYRKVFSTSYSFTVDPPIGFDELQDWAKQCFPHNEYVICCGSQTHHAETALFLVNQTFPE